MKSGYKVCPKCKVRHSTLVRHRCFKLPEDKDAPATRKPPKEHEDLGKGGETVSTDRVSDPTASDDKGDAEEREGENTDADGDADDAEGEGEESTEGEGTKGDGEEGEDGKEGEGEEGSEKREGEGEEGDGETEGEAEDEAPEPEYADPEDPPVQVVCSVLKFAALCAQCAKNGSINVTLTEAGLLVFGENGGTVASATMTWREFEGRSTIDGQFYVKGVIDGVDERLGAAPPEALDLAVGDLVATRDGSTGEVVEEGYSYAAA